MADDPQKGKGAAAPVLPWPTTLTLVGAAMVVLLPSLLLIGQGGAFAAVGGFVLGAFAIISGGMGMALRAGPAMLAVILCLIAIPGYAFATLVGLLLVIGTGFEAHRYGTRVVVFAIFTYLTVRLGLLQDGSWNLALTYAAGFIAGAAATHWRRLTGMFPKVKISRAEAVALAVFIGIGLLITDALMAWLQTPRSYWIALLFTMRGIMPLQAQRAAVLTFGKAASIGVVIAVLAEVLGLPTEVRLILALIFATLGIRYVVHPRPFASMLFSAAVLLCSTATLQDAIYRAQAIVIVVLLVLFLVAALDWVFARIVDRLPDDAEDGAGA
ncbi:hypothetical protein [Pseudoruegeria sp. HB172150]|uniref:hypothetical protein n=1 Tax=Pseudoruegeria sp. HB172150 TaxID=2721164 RepID=UPI001555D6A7|nr:hypothetical protein [Pseudoruegeria sp. HB172150]